MNDARDNLPVLDIDCNLGLSACSIQSHDECDSEECQVRRAEVISELLTEGQIRVGVATAIAGIVVSSIFAIGVLGVWIFHALQGNAMPDIPLIIVSIAGAPFAAGVITTLKIPKKAKVLLEEKQ